VQPGHVSEPGSDRIRTAETSKIPNMLVVGERERQSESIVVPLRQPRSGDADLPRLPGAAREGDLDALAAGLTPRRRTLRASGSDPRSADRLQHAPTERHFSGREAEGAAGRCSRHTLHSHDVPARCSTPGGAHLYDGERPALGGRHRCHRRRRVLAPGARRQSI
jgi:hypothetical protein